MHTSRNSDGSKEISIKVKNLIFRKPGITNNEIIVNLPKESQECLVSAICVMRDSGMIIVRDDKNFALGHSIKAKIKRHRQKHRINTKLLLRKD